MTRGSRVAALEQAVAGRCGAAHAVAVSGSGAGLQLVTAALRLGPGDVLLTSPIAPVAAAASARHLGAEVDFCDVRADTATMDPEALVARVAQHGGRVRVIAPVDVAGIPADLELIRGVADRIGAFVLEDAGEALGAEVRFDDGWIPVGSGRGAHACVFTLPAGFAGGPGELGVIVTDDGDLAARLRRLRHHGIRAGADLGIDDVDPWYHEVHELGFDCHPGDVAAALAHRQLARLDRRLEARRAAAAAYRGALASCPDLELLELPDDRRPAHPWYPIRLRRPRRPIWDRLVGAGIHPTLHHLAIHLHPYYRDDGHRPGDFPVAEDHSRRSLSLPVGDRYLPPNHAKILEIIAGV